MPRQQEATGSAAGFWLLALGCLTLATATRHSDIARLLVHWLVQPFGLPDHRDALAQAPAAAAAVLAMLALTRRSTAAWWSRSDPAQLLLALVVFTHAIGLLALFDLQERLELPWQLDNLHWSDSGFTTLTLLHSELGRAALETLRDGVSMLTGPPVTAGDRTLHGLLPAMERWAMAVPLLAACAAALAAAPGTARRQQWHPVAIAVFILATLHCLLGALDGGALAPGQSGSLLMLALLGGARDTAHLRSLVRRHGLAACAVVVAVACGRAALARDGWGSVVPDLALPGLIYGTALVCWAFRDEAGALARAAALAATACFLGVSYLDDALSGTGLLLRPLPPEARIVVIDAAGRAARDASTAMRGATPLAVYRRFGDDPLAPRRVLIDAHPPDMTTMAPAATDRPGREFAFAVRFMQGQPAPSSAPGGLYSLLAATRVPDRTNTALFLFRTASPLIPPFRTGSSNVLDRNNFNAHLHLVAAALQAQGLDAFMLMPLLDVRDRERFVPVRRARGGAGT